LHALFSLSDFFISALFHTLFLFSVLLHCFDVVDTFLAFALDHLLLFEFILFFNLLVLEEGFSTLVLSLLALFLELSLDRVQKLALLLLLLFNFSLSTASGQSDLLVSNDFLLSDFGLKKHLLLRFFLLLGLTASKQFFLVFLLTQTLFFLSHSLGFYLRLESAL
jgi:hypothetical protein